MNSKMQPFWWFKAPPAPPVPTERIVNGGFETGDFTGWATYGSYNVVTDHPHSGIYCAHLGYVSSITQVLSEPVAVDDIVSFTCWIYGHDVLGQHSNAYIRITYDDATTTDIYVDAPNDAWAEVDILSYLTAGKNVSEIRIRSWVDNAKDLWVDDVSLMA